MLAPKQTRFVEEYLIDLNGKKAAIRAGYSSKTAEVQASRMLRNVKVQKALELAIRERSRRTEITADSVVAELAKIAFSNIRDYWPKEGEPLDLHRIDRDRTAAVEEITVVEEVDTSGVPHRRTSIKMHDKLAALANLARHLGMFSDWRVAEGSIEQRVLRMTPQERQALVEELLERAEKNVLLFEPDQRERPLAQTEGPAVENEGRTGGTVPRQRHRSTRERHA
jgi:phage terminase small subunit